MKNVFIKDNSTDTYDYIEEGVMFGDYLWNDITDQDITNVIEFGGIIDYSGEITTGRQ